MKKTLSTYEAAGYLMNDENANWSRAGAYALVEYLEQLEADTGEEIEIDAVSLRCEWTEYGSALEAARNYGFDWTPELYDADDAERDSEEIEEELEKESMEWLENRSTIISFDGGIIVRDF